MKCAVIGAAGFLGATVIEELQDRGREVLALDMKPSRPANTPASVAYASVDIRHKEALARALEGCDEVYHFAAKLGTAEMEDDLRSAIETNVMGALNVFEASIMTGVSRVFYSSKPSVWLNVYTITKHCGEQISRLFNLYQPISICALRFLNIYGPGQKIAPVKKVLPIFAAQALRGLPIQINGDGEQTVDMLFSKDAARMTVDYTATGHTAEPCDCGTGVAMTINQLASDVNAYFGNTAGVRHMDMRKGETDRTHLVADTDALVGVIGPLKLTPWEQALDESLAWYRNLPAAQIDAALSYYNIRKRHVPSWN